jgi:hypothetical protein
MKASTGTGTTVASRTGCARTGTAFFALEECDFRDNNKVGDDSYFDEADL